MKDPKTYNILVIEDNPGDYFLFEEYIHEKIEKPKLKHIERFSQLQNMSENINEFDVVFLDLILPDKSGTDLVKDVLLLSKKTPVVILTGHTDCKYALNTISLGATDYILKDELNSLELYNCIVSNLDRHNN
jgi:DNA-binding NtrC family response regulator